MARHRLTKLRVERVDLTNAGANPGATVALFKSRNPAPLDAITDWQAKDLRTRATAKARQVCKYVATETHPDLEWRDAVEKFLDTEDGQALHQAAFDDAYEEYLAVARDALSTVPEPTDPLAKYMDHVDDKKDGETLADITKELRDELEISKGLAAEIAAARYAINADPIVLKQRSDDKWALMNRLARAYSVAKGVTVEKAHDVLAQSDATYRSAYAGYQEITKSQRQALDDHGYDVARLDVRVKKGASVWEEIVKNAKRELPDEDEAHAVAKYCDTDEGKALYVEYIKSVKPLTAVTSSEMFGKVGGDAGAVTPTPAGPQPTHTATFSGPDLRRVKETTGPTSVGEGDTWEGIKAAAAKAFPDIADESHRVSQYLNTSEGAAHYKRSRSTLVKNV